MITFLLTLLFGAGGQGNHFGIANRIAAGVADRVVTVRVTSADDPADDSADSSSDSPDTDNSDLEVIPPVPPVPPVNVNIPPIPPMPKGFQFHFDSGDKGGVKFSETGKAVSTVEILHRIASAAGWSMTIVGSPKDTIDVAFTNLDAREALRQVLKQAGAMGVLKNDKLVIVASPDPNTAGMLIERVTSRGGTHAGHPVTVKVGGGRHGGRDMVRVFQGDLTVPAGQVVQGDVVCVGGSVELEAGSVVQGDTVSVGGSVQVDEGALVMGQAVAVLGTVDVARGAQVMGEHVQVGIGKLFGSSGKSHRGWLTGLGPFGLFPTIALFALCYLIGLLVLRMWPERVRNVGFAMFENPVRSFTVGFLCWLLLLPLTVLLAISIVGIPLIPLLPVMVFLSIVVGLSSFALRIGESLPAGPGQRFVPPAALGMGMTVLLLLAFVPWLGISLLALLQFFALGASVSSRFGRALPPHPA
jgi:uncharacterized membrane protein